MSDSIWQEKEELLAAAHRVMSGRIEERPPGPNDDAEAEYAEDELVRAAAKLARAKLAVRLEKSKERGGPRSALEQRINRHVEQLSDDATSAVSPSWLRTDSAEAAVMEMALIEIADTLDGENLDPEAAREMARDALPDGAGKS